MCSDNGEPLAASIYNPDGIREALLRWSKELIDRKLDDVADKTVQNLLKLMLSPEDSSPSSPSPIPSIERILQHPFISKRANVVRLAGQKPLYDIAIGTLSF